AKERARTLSPTKALVIWQKQNGEEHNKENGEDIPVTKFREDKKRGNCPRHGLPANSQVPRG
ncbi:hypothetical protein A2U01_0079226, partial [Trifolium medium]|nr:hypothetical protein [Trifolium medium]